MHFAKTLILCASAVATVVAQQTQRIAFTELPSTIQAGKPITLHWAGGNPDVPVTLILQQGSFTNLQTVALVTGSATGNSYTYNVPSNLPNAGNYAFKIQQGNDDPNYTGMISLTGGTTGGITNAISATAASASSKATGTTGIVEPPYRDNSTAANATSTASSSNRTATAVGTGASASGTGTAIARNTTMSSATLSATASSSGSTSGSSTVATTTTGRSSATAASSSARASSSSSAGQVASNFALLVCAFASVAYLG